jgi:hypothetical protein
MILAIWTIGFVAIVLTVLCAAVTGEIRRAGLLAEDAELRQLLLAGTDAARLRLAAALNESGSWTIDLPGALADQHAQLTMTIAAETRSDATVPAGSVAPAGGTRFAQLDAILPHHRMHETLRMVDRSGNGAWTVDDVVTDPAE